MTRVGEVLAMTVMGAPTGIETIAEAFARARANGRRAALMPYLMGGYPDLETSRAIGLAYAEAGADLVELGVPFSDPLADGPVIHAAGTAALRAGATLPAVLEVARDIAAHVPVVLMCYANPILSQGLERFLDALVGARVSGLIVPDLPLEEATEVRPACRRARPGLRPAGRADHPGRAAGADRRRRQRLPLHGLADRDHRRAHARWPAGWPP